MNDGAISKHNPGRRRNRPFAARKIARARVHGLLNVGRQVSGGCARQNASPLGDGHVAQSVLQALSCPDAPACRIGRVVQSEIKPGQPGALGRAGGVGKVSTQCSVSSKYKLLRALDVVHRCALLRPGRVGYDDFVGAQAEPNIRLASHVKNHRVGIGSEPTLVGVGVFRRCRACCVKVHLAANKRYRRLCGAAGAVEAKAVLSEETGAHGLTPCKMRQ